MQHFTKEAIKYELEIVQEPSYGRMSTEQDKRVIGPPLIVRLLKYDDREVEMQEFNDANRFYCHLTLVRNQDETQAPQDLSGSRIVNCRVLNDENDKLGMFFCFPDISVQSTGAFHLELRAFIINPTFKALPVLCHGSTGTFHVYPTKSFPDTEDSTDLTRLFALQGIPFSCQNLTAK